MAKKTAKSKKENSLLVVGLGASAGGLEALKSFFSSMPENSGMAFIVIMHLSPEHESSMAELLQMQTTLKVTQANDQDEIEEGHVYVIPPNKIRSVGDSHLELSEVDHQKEAVIDLFFRSLGKGHGRKCVSIVLSGTGSDGSTGLKTVKEEGGMAIVQDPKEAKYDGMPRSAINTGLVDKVLAVKEMPDELQRYKKNLFEITVSDHAEELKDGDTEIVETILEKVRAETNHNFQNYKRTSVLRRIKRRMQVNRVTQLSDYLSYLEENPDEIKELFKDLLISVTNFFRDEKTFAALREKVIPKLFEDKSRDDQIRVWIPGCATGEEAYSIAMLLTEYARNTNAPPEIQLFATDIDKSALGIARAGRFPESIAADLSSRQLEQYFIKDGFEYQIKSEISNMILFAGHDLLRDPPFSKLDLISCRNLLIYLNRKLQSQVFDLFHYALRAGGRLFLGQSDSSLEATELFTPVDKKHQIYRQKPTSNSDFHIPELPSRFGKGVPRAMADGHKSPERSKTGFEELHRELMMKRYIPPSLIINGDYDVLHSSGPIDKYLNYSGGEPSRNLLEMITPGLKQPLRNALFQAGKEDVSLPLYKQVQYNREDETRQVEIVIHAVDEADVPDGLMYVVFKEEKAAKLTAAKNIDTASGEEAEIIEALEKELEYTKEQLSVSVEDYETSNEELRASNEELQSMNEELQSTTEELETSKEELQSVNEELKTVNEELEGKIEKLHRSNNDLKNLMEATEIGTIFIDREYRVQRFTQSVTKIFNLIQSDEGRPLEHVTNNLEYDSILDDVKQVLENLEKVKKTVTAKNGHSYNMRLRPYRTTEDKIEGAVITFVEVTDLKQARDELEHELKQQGALANLSIYAMETDDLASIIHRTQQTICIIFKVDYVLLMSLDETKSELRLNASTGLGDVKEDEKSIGIDKNTDAGYTLQQDENTVTEDFSKEERFSKNPWLKNKNVSSGAFIVVEGTGENAYGVLGVYTEKKQKFTDSEIHFMRVAANLVGISMERKKAQNELWTSNEQLEDKIVQNKKLQREILKANVNERWQIGEYLHDDLAQLLVAAIMQADSLNKKLKETGKNAPELDKIKEYLTQASESTRKLSHVIIPIDIRQEGLQDAFGKLVDDLEEVYDVSCELVADDIFKKIKDPELASNLYRITQEAARNAAIHGKAENIKITIRLGDSTIKLMIEDDGTGFSKAAKDGDKEGMGLELMKHRLELIDGTLEINDKSAESGTKGIVIECKVPFTK